MDLGQAIRHTVPMSATIVTARPSHDSYPSRVVVWLYIKDNILTSIALKAEVSLPYLRSQRRLDLTLVE
jgi:hypothetical protein